MVPDLTLLFVGFSLVGFKENVQRVLTRIEFDWSSFEFSENFRKKRLHYMYTVAGTRQKFSFSSTYAKFPKLLTLYMYMLYIYEHGPWR
jgi:hypothetical protein